MSTSLFVEQLYQQFLGRDADLAGLEYWSDLIDSNQINSAQATQFFLDSQEFSQLVSPIVQLYYAALGRTPDSDGLSYWVEAYQKGMTINEVSQHLVQSNEFSESYGHLTQKEFINLLYLNVLQRDADEAGQSYWSNQLDSGSARADIVVGFALSEEFYLAKSDEIKTILAYHGILDITPTQSQIDAATQNANPIELMTQLYLHEDYQGVSVPGLASEGVVVDGYIRDATVFIDANGDGIHNPDEISVTTDSLGHFDFGDNPGFGTLIIYGGTDISTGQPFEGHMSAASGSSVVSPLTTLVHNLSRDNAISVQDANIQVLSELGLDESIDLQNFDPVAIASNPMATPQAINTALSIQAAATKVNTLIGQTAALLTGSDLSQDEDSAIQAAYQTLADTLAQNPTINLDDENTIQSLIASTANQLGANSSQLDQLQQISEDTAKTTALLNQSISQAINNHQNPNDILAQIAELQIISETIENEVKNGASNGDVSHIFDQATNAINNPATPDPVNPPSTPSDTTAPEILAGPIWISATTLSITVDEAATVGLYDTNDSSLIGTTSALTAYTPGEISVTPPSIVEATEIIVIDSAGNRTVSDGVVLGTENDNRLYRDDFVFGFDGDDFLQTGKGDFTAMVFDGGLGADTIFWLGANAKEMSRQVYTSPGVAYDFSSGVRGDDIIFESGIDKLQFEANLLSNQSGNVTDTLLKISKGGIVTNSARFVYIDATAQDHSELFAGAQVVLDNLDTSQVSIGDSFIAAIDNDTDTYLYLVEQKSAADTIATQDMTLIGRLNGTTELADGDAITVDNVKPEIITGPTITSSSQFSLTFLEDATVSLHLDYGDYDQVGSSISFSMNQPNHIAVTAQSSQTVLNVKAEDKTGNEGYVAQFTMGTDSGEYLYFNEIVFGFDGNDTILTHGKGYNQGPSVVDGGLGADTIYWAVDSKYDLAQAIGVEAGTAIDFKAGFYGHDIYFEAGMDTLQFQKALLTNAAGNQDDTLLKIAKGGIVTNQARFVYISDATASDHAEQFSGAQALLDLLDTSAVNIGDSFVAAIDNDVDTYLYLIHQVSNADTIAEQDITLIGRLNGITEVSNGDFVTLDDSAPQVLSTPTRVSSHEISLTVNETANAGIYHTSDSSLIGSTFDLTAQSPSNISFTAQPSATEAQIIIKDLQENRTHASDIILGSDNADKLFHSDFVFGFDGADIISTHSSKEGASVIDGGSGADIIYWQTDNISDLAKFVGVQPGIAVDFQVGEKGDDIIFESTIDTLQFETNLLANSTGVMNDSLLKINKGGIVTNSARFVYIDAQYDDHAEQFSQAQILLDNLDTSAVKPGDSFIAAIDNDSHTYLYYIQQISTANTVNTQDMTLLGRLNGTTDLSDGDFKTVDTHPPSIISDSLFLDPATGINFTVNEDAQAGLRSISDSTLIGDYSHFSGHQSNSIAVTAQPSLTNSSIHLSDTHNNGRYSYHVGLGTDGDDTISLDGIIFGFDGSDTISGGKSDNFIDAGPGSDSIFGYGGKDTIFFDIEASSSIYDTFNDPEYGDKIRFSGTDNGTSIFNSNAVNYQTSVQQTLDQATSGDGSTNSIYQWFSDGSDAYIVIDLSAEDTFVNGVDGLIKVVGKTDLSDLKFNEADQSLTFSS